MRIASSPADYRSTIPFLVRESGLWCVGAARLNRDWTYAGWVQETTWCKTAEAAVEQYCEYHPHFRDAQEHHA